MHVIFSTLFLGIWKCGQTHSFMFDKVCTKLLTTAQVTTTVTEVTSLFAMLYSHAVTGN